MDALNLEKSSHPSGDSLSASLNKSSHQEEHKDKMCDLPGTSKNSKRYSEANDRLIIMQKQHPHSSNQLIMCSRSNSANMQTDGLQVANNNFFRNDTNVSMQDELSFQFENPPLRRSNSLEKKAIIAQGRSPQVPFVQNLRSSLKRNSSQRLQYRRNFSPQEQHAADNSEMVVRRSFGKSLNDSCRKKRGPRDPTSSAEKGSHSQISSSNTTPLHPEEVFKKYEDFPDSSLKLSTYKEMSMLIY